MLRVFILSSKYYVFECACSYIPTVSALNIISTPTSGDFLHINLFPGLLIDFIVHVRTCSTVTNDRFKFHILIT